MTKQTIAGNKIQVDVTVVLEPGPPTGPKHKMSGPIADGNKLTFQSPNDEAFLVRFTIDDSAMPDRYYFPRNTIQALSVRPITQQAKEKCPHGHHVWDEFQVTGISDDCKTLEVTNLNSYLQYFCFALFVGKNADHGPFFALDPIGDNQNGGFAN